MFPLITPRLSMRPMEARDWRFFYRFQCDQAVMAFICDPRSEEEVRADFAGRILPWGPESLHWLCLVIEDRNTGEPLGVTGFVKREEGIAEVGFIMAGAHHHKGYGSESLAGVCKFAFRHCHFRKLIATVTVGNQGSRRVLEKQGFVLEGTLRENYWLGERWQDDWVFGLLRHEYQAARI